MTPLHRAWTDGVIAGLREYAWWKDGTQYVGSCGTTLKDAIARAETVWADEPDDGSRMMRWNPHKAKYEELT